MKIKPVNDIIGSWVCAYGGAAEVYQTKKQGRHFYTRCDCCGLNQGTGKSRQQSIWDSAKFIDKTSIAVPSGVEVGGFIEAEKVGAPSEEKGEPGPAADFDPAEIQSEPAAVKAEGVLSKLAPFLVVALAIGAGAWMN